MKKILKVFFIILLITVLLIILWIGRKVIILDKLDKSVSNLEDTKDNIYIKIDNIVDSYVKVVSEVFIKDETEKSVFSMGDTLKGIQIVYPNERKVFIDSKENKIVHIYEETAPKRTTDINAAPHTHTVIMNFANSMNFVERVVMAFNTNIKVTNIDDKQYYELSGLHSPIFFYQENTISMVAYVEKDTGLPVKMVEKYEENGVIKEKITAYQVKFDCVTDEDLIEPDISEYTLQNN